MSRKAGFELSSFVGVNQWGKVLREERYDWLVKLI